MNLLKRVILCACIISLASCQKNIYGPAEECKIIQMSDLQWSEMPEDSTSFTKFVYDSIGRVKNVILMTGDTDKYYYTPNRIFIEEPRTYDRGGGPVTDVWTSEFGLNASGMAAYATTQYNGWGVMDSTVYTYDGNGYLTQERYYDFFAGLDDYVIDYTYKDGNLVKAVYSPYIGGNPDSILYKYSDIDVPAELPGIFQQGKRYAWLGKGNKKLTSEVAVYYPWGEVVTSKFEAMDLIDGKPSVIRGVRTSNGRPGVSVRSASYISYKCD